MKASPIEIKGVNLSKQELLAPYVVTRLPLWPLNGGAYASHPGHVPTSVALLPDSTLLHSTSSGMLAVLSGDRTAIMVVDATGGKRAEGSYSDGALIPNVGWVGPMGSVISPFITNPSVIGIKNVEASNGGQLASGKYWIFALTYHEVSGSLLLLGYDARYLDSVGDNAKLTITLDSVPGAKKVRLYVQRNTDGSGFGPLTFLAELTGEEDTFVYDSHLQEGEHVQIAIPVPIGGHAAFYAGRYFYQAKQLWVIDGGGGGGSGDGAIPFVGNTMVLPYQAWQAATPSAGPITLVPALYHYNSAINVQLPDGSAVYFDGVHFVLHHDWKFHTNIANINTLESPIGGAANPDGSVIVFVTNTGIRAVTIGRYGQYAPINNVTDFIGVVHDGTQFIAATSSGYVYTSEDGIKWSIINLSSYVNGAWVGLAAVGKNVYILDAAATSIYIQRFSGSVITNTYRLDGYNPDGRFYLIAKRGANILVGFGAGSDSSKTDEFVEIDEASFTSGLNIVSTWSSPAASPNSYGKPIGTDGDVAYFYNEADKLLYIVGPGATSRLVDLSGFGSDVKVAYHKGKCVLSHASTSFYDEIDSSGAIKPIEAPVVGGVYKPWGITPKEGGVRYALMEMHPWNGAPRKMKSAVYELNTHFQPALAFISETTKGEIVIVVVSEPNKNNVVEYAVYYGRPPQLTPIVYGTKQVSSFPVPIGAGGDGNSVVAFVGNTIVHYSVVSRLGNSFTATSQPVGVVSSGKQVFLACENGLHAVSHNGTTLVAPVPDVVGYAHGTAGVLYLVSLDGSVNEVDINSYGVTAITAIPDAPVEWAVGRLIDGRVFILAETATKTTLYSISSGTATPLFDTGAASIGFQVDFVPSTYRKTLNVIDLPKNTVVWSEPGTINVCTPYSYYKPVPRSSKEITGIASSSNGVLIMMDGEIIIGLGTFVDIKDTRFAIYPAVIGQDSGAGYGYIGSAVLVVWGGRVYIVDGSNVEHVSLPVDDGVPFVSAKYDRRNAMIVALKSDGRVYRFSLVNRVWFDDMEECVDIAETPDGVLYLRNNEGNARFYRLAKPEDAIGEGYYRIPQEVWIDAVKLAGESMKRLRAIYADFNAEGPVGCTVSIYNENEAEVARAQMNPAIGANAYGLGRYRLRFPPVVSYAPKRIKFTFSGFNFTMSPVLVLEYEERRRRV